MYLKDFLFFTGKDQPDSFLQDIRVTFQIAQ